MALIKVKVKNGKHKTGRNLDTGTKLRRFAKRHGMRHDWHEPDEQGVTAKVVGSKLDNAMGDEPYVMPWNGRVYEMVVCLKGPKGNTLNVNLATVLALAAGNSR